MTTKHVQTLGASHDAVPAVALTGVSIEFPRHHEDPLTIVRGFDLRIPPGTMHCLAGRSGSGKTSVLRVAVGTLTPTAGTVQWAGTPIHTLAPKQLANARRAHMGYVDQKATVIEELTVLDNVLLPAIPLKITEAHINRAHALLATLGLGDRAKQRAKTLSGGERQRLAIARALLVKPTAIALDEPTASLDAKAALTVIDALHTITQEGTAIIVASHDSSVISAAHTATHLS